MIGYLKGEVVVSDGVRTILLDESGVGHEIFFNKTLPQGDRAGLYIACIIKENTHELYGLPSFESKKLFELLISVKGVGAKSAFSLINHFEERTLIQAISKGEKSLLKQVQGIGPKAAAQIILDLGEKIKKMKPTLKEKIFFEEKKFDRQIENDALEACQALGFENDRIIPLMEKIIEKHPIHSPEQLTRLILKEI